ncbi:MAG: type I restriction endonuclease subunit R [Rhodobacteraceae bacterium]|nr:type I restriction endonuclease subunit R [Paracoccaceae bacterium]
MTDTSADTYTTANIHQEQVFEAHIVACLAAGQGYEERDCASHYDVAHALDSGLLFRFLKTTQPDAWQALNDYYSNQAEAEVLKRLDQALGQNPTHVVLRDGIKLVPNIRFRLCFFKPASNLNPELARLYRANILSVMRQVTYSAKNRNAIDLVTFVNGIPVATLEVKNRLTGQNVKHAENQYRQDRSPAGEPLLTFKRGAIVHFAVDQDNVSMTTRLMNGRTRFLPFNRGRAGGAGNPDVPGENRVAYLYKNLPGEQAVFSREVLLALIGQLIHLERTGGKSGSTSGGKSGGKEVLIFPRFQQLDAVRKVLADARCHGAGQNYLIQHSAGSGKSNTIAWTAHQIIHLHDAHDKPRFDTAIIVTDRLVLDKQLKDTIGGFARTKGVVKKIDGTSRDLKAAILNGARIIITTIQKFGTEHLATISDQSGKNFAVIVDEAHSSQSGKAAQSMTDALTRDATGSEDVEDAVLAFQKARGPQKNISFLAFTATPRNVTLERFGHTGSDGKPRPFHLYSMRQAIEEGFILDVLQHYMTYSAYYQLEKTIEDDPAFLGGKAQARVARYATLHPAAIDQKVAVIVEHFRRHVMQELDGQAKAMIVTQSREHALRYWQCLNKYVGNKGYTDLKALVAFSGQLEIDGATWHERTANGFAETELPQQFDTDEYRILIVAEKYQTGFDQPKLVAMYVDKKLANLQAVQTLSRLNRTRAGKDRTFVLDFQNTMQDVKQAFAPFFEATTLEERTDPNQIYDLEQRIAHSVYINKDDVERFAETFFKGALSHRDRVVLEGIIRHAVRLFDMDENEAQREEFRQLLKSFQRFYAFVAQVVKLNDTWLEKLYAYTSWLSRLLPSRDVPADISVTDDMLNLSAFKLQKGEEGSAALAAGDGTALDPITEFGANPYTEEEEKSLSEIIDSFNERHGTRFSREDFLRFERVTRDIMDKDMTAMMRNNPADVVENAFNAAFLKGVAHAFHQDSEMHNIIMTDPEARARVTRHCFMRAQRQARETPDRIG